MAPSFFGEFVMTETKPYRQREHLDYPQKTMFQMVESAAQRAGSFPAYEFYGRKTSYRQFIARIERAARAFLASGINPGDAVTICMPNVSKDMKQPRLSPSIR